MDWFSPEMWVGFGIGVGLVLTILTFDWLKDDYVKPYLNEKRRRRIIERSKSQINMDRREKELTDLRTASRGGQVEPQVSFPPPVRPPAEPSTDAIGGVSTQEYPAPSTSMIDVTKPPPPVPQRWQPPEKIGGYMASGEPITEMPKVPSGPAPGGARPRTMGPETGPAFERRTRVDSDYEGPERRHRSDQPRMTRAEARRLREAEESAPPSEHSE